MTGKEFAEKYLGCRIVYKSRWTPATPSTVVGYGIKHNQNEFCYSPDDVNDGVLWSEHSTYVKLLPRKRFWALDVAQFIVSGEFIDTPQSTNKPDDCLDCGAVGEEKCKITCPNRNN